MYSSQRSQLLSCCPVGNFRPAGSELVPGVWSLVREGEYKLRVVGVVEDIDDVGADDACKWDHVRFEEGRVKT